MRLWGTLLIQTALLYFLLPAAVIKGARTKMNIFQSKFRVIAMAQIPFYSRGIYRVKETSDFVILSH